MNSFELHNYAPQEFYSTTRATRAMATLRDDRQSQTSRTQVRRSALAVLALKVLHVFSRCFARLIGNTYSQGEDE